LAAAGLAATFGGAFVTEALAAETLGAETLGAETLAGEALAAAAFEVLGAVLLAITVFTVRDLAAADLALAALAEPLETPRRDAAAFLVLGLLVLVLVDLAILLERGVLLDTTCAWNRHAPVHGLFSGESCAIRPIKGGLSIPAS
jgi:hypothetical protein